jgi:hypothetical protein
MKPIFHRIAIAMAMAIASAVSASGCGTIGGAATPTAPGTTVGPHGGTAVPLPGDRGYAEVQLDRTGVKPGRPGGARLNVYFLASDLKAPLSASPTEVTVKAIPPGGEALTLTLRPDAPGDKKAAPGRFTSPPGDLDYDELRGEVSATIDGQTSTVPFAFR